MTKAEFLEALRTERARWEALLAQVPEARMTKPGVEGEWSVKDIIAHVAWHEREMAGVLRARALVGSDLWQLPLDERNAALFDLHRDHSLQAVLDEARQAYQAFLAEAEKLSYEDLNDPGRYADMPPSWEPWDLLAGNSFTHYPDHYPAIQQWLDKANATT
jgi:hypothetical protein